jgi:chromosome segregation ATPase
MKKKKLNEILKSQLRELNKSENKLSILQLQLTESQLKLQEFQKLESDCKENMNNKNKEIETLKNTNDKLENEYNKIRQEGEQLEEKNNTLQNENKKLQNNNNILETKYSKLIKNIYEINGIKNNQEIIKSIETAIQEINSEYTDQIQRGGASSPILHLFH